MTTWTQDYPALPGSAQAAAQYARTIVEPHLPGRADDAQKIVNQMFMVGITRSTPQSNMNLITVIDDDVRGHVHFELHYANDAADMTTDPPTAHQLLSALSDAYGEQGTRTGKLLYAELWASAA